MCTAFVRNGNDRIVGFNFDADESIYTYKICKTKALFYVGIVMGATTYKTHGVNRNGNAGNLPYMNGPLDGDGAYRRGAQFKRLDLLNSDYIAGKCSYAELLETVKTKTIVNPPHLSMHTQFSDADGHILLVEPGVGFKEVDGAYSIIANFPALRPVNDPENPFYGMDRYHKGLDILRGSTPAFSVSDGLALLEAAKQGGQWATRVSYVYSQNENAVYYVLNGDFSKVYTHRFA